jgi:hypothetical protein
MGLAASELAVVLSKHLITMSNNFSRRLRIVL